MTRVLAAALLLALSTAAGAVECLPSARAVWNMHPGMHATWRRIDGNKCWFESGKEHVQSKRLRMKGVLVPPRRASVLLPRPRLDWEVIHPERYQRASIADGEAFMREFLPSFDERFKAVQ